MVAWAAAIPSLLQAAGGVAGNAAIFSGAAGSGGADSYEDAVRILERVNEPDFDFRELSPPELRVFAEFFPQVYEARVPDEVKLIADSDEGRAGQVDALRQVQRVAQEGLPISEQIATREAMRSLARQARREDQDIIANLEARGRLGGGTEINARLGQAQARNDLARGMGADLASMREMNRYRAAIDSADLSSQLRGQDVGVQAQNAAMINRFNEYVSSALTQAARDAAAAQNAGQLYNVEQRQRIGEGNEMARYAAAQDNLARRNQLEGAQFDAALRKAGAVAGTTQDLGRTQYADQAGREASLRGLFGGGASVGSGIAQMFAGQSGAAQSAAQPTAVQQPYQNRYHAPAAANPIVDYMVGRSDSLPWDEKKTKSIFD